MTIFLAGGHGVGKSYLASRTAGQVALLHVTASQLIREERGRASWTPDRRVTEVDENQLALIGAVGRHHFQGERLLLDGHFVLRGADNQLVRLGVSIFARLRISATILLEAPADIVAQRLASRFDLRAHAESIAELACAEHEHAVYVCAALQVPLTILTVPTEVEFRDTLQQIVLQQVAPSA